ncbi:MAG TPA: hypothetical protein PK135_14185 [Arenimonas sp.]|nr:hypothetical protein [Arenimonas sp.]
MKLMTISLAAGLLLSLGATTVHADTLLIERVQAEQNQALPKRGASMASVEARFGTPQQKMSAVGGGSRHTPPITRWVYANFSVYFENNHVVDSVLTRANAEEVGPAPARQ